MLTLQTSTRLPVATTKMLPYGTQAATEPGMLADVQLIASLLDFGQVLCQKTPGRGLCHAVRQITQERAHLHLGGKKLLDRQNFASNTFITIPVHFGHVLYGVLYITCDPVQAELASIPISVAQLFAQACAWILHTFEQSNFLQEQCQPFEDQVHGSLTKRELEILQLIHRGCNREKIADLLSIAPATLRKHRQHIYAQLGVHNERDALLAAYHGGLLSPLEEILS